MGWFTPDQDPWHPPSRGCVRVVPGAEPPPVPGVCSLIVGKDAPGPHRLPGGQASSLPSPGCWGFCPAVLCLTASSVRDPGGRGVGYQPGGQPWDIRALDCPVPGLGLKGMKQGWEELPWLWHGSGTALHTLPVAACLGLGGPGCEGSRLCLGDIAFHLPELAADGRRGLAAYPCPLSRADSTCWNCGTAGTAATR